MVPAVMVAGPAAAAAGRAATAAAAPVARATGEVVSSADSATLFALWLRGMKAHFCCN